MYKFNYIPICNAILSWIRILTIQAHPLVPQKLEAEKKRKKKEKYNKDQKEEEEIEKISLFQRELEISD